MNTLLRTGPSIVHFRSDDPFSSARQLRFRQHGTREMIVGCKCTYPSIHLSSRWQVAQKLANMLESLVRLHVQVFTFHCTGKLKTLESCTCWTPWGVPKCTKEIPTQLLFLWSRGCTLGKAGTNSIFSHVTRKQTTSFVDNANSACLKHSEFLVWRGCKQREMSHASSRTQRRFEGLTTGKQGNRSPVTVGDPGPPIAGTYRVCPQHLGL